MNDKPPVNERAMFRAICKYYQAQYEKDNLDAPTLDTIEFISKIDPVLASYFSSARENMKNAYDHIVSKMDSKSG